MNHNITKAEGSKQNVYISENTVIKIPKMDFHPGYILIYKLIKKDRINTIYKYYHGNIRGKLKDDMPRGIMENIREGKTSLNFYKDLQDLVVPTRLSVFGMVNFQDIACDIDINKDDFLSIMKNNINEDIWSGSHTFKNLQNYGIHDNRVKIRDYGERNILEILRANKTQFLNAFEEINELIIQQHNKLK